MTVHLYKHQDHERSTGIQVFDVEMQPSVTSGEKERDLRSYVEKARVEQQTAETHRCAEHVPDSDLAR